MALSLKEKLLEMRYQLGINKSEVARRLDISSQLYGRYEKGEITPKLDFYKKYQEVFGIDLTKDEQIVSLDADLKIKPSKEKEIITFGKHAPLRLTSDEYSAAFGDWKGLPIYNSPISASFISQYHDEKIMNPMYYLHDPRFKDCQFGAVITGDSMHSEIRHGDIAMCREIVDKSFIVFGDIYYVVAENGLETCKYINAGSDDNTLMLVPRNDLISPSPIKKDMVKNLYKVRGIIRGY